MDYGKNLQCWAYTKEYTSSHNTTQTPYVSTVYRIEHIQSELWKKNLQFSHFYWTRTTQLPT